MLSGGGGDGHGDGGDIWECEGDMSDGDVIFMYLCQCSQTSLNDLLQSFVSLMTPRLGMTHI